MTRLAYIVDEVTPDRQALALCLSNLGFEIRLFANGEDALYAMGAEPPHLLMLSCQLKDMTPFELLDGLAVDHAELVVFLTGVRNLDDACRAVDLGVVGLFPKPINLKRLIHKIESLDAFFPSLDADAAPAEEETHRAAPAAAGAAAPPANTMDALAALEAEEPAAPAPAAAQAAAETDAEAALRDFKAELRATARFKKVLMLTGTPASDFIGAIELINRVTVSLKEQIVICEPIELTEENLVNALAQAISAGVAMLFAFLDVDTISPEKQRVLYCLLKHKPPFNFAQAAYRVIVCATSDIEARVNAGDFDEMLFFELSLSQVLVPPSLHITV